MLGGGVDAATLVAALGAGPPPPECRWGRAPTQGNVTGTGFSSPNFGLGFVASLQMASVAALTALRAAARECQLAAPIFSDEQAAQGLAITEDLRARFLPPAASAQASSPLLQLPAELLTVILSRLDTRDLARLAATCRSLCRDALTPPPPPRQIGPVETELRRRAVARNLKVGPTLPEGATSWVACLLKRDRRDAQMHQAPLAVGPEHSIFVDKGGRLLTCGRDSGDTPCLGHSVDPADADPTRQIGPPTPVPSMQDKRIVSVAASDCNCLALSAEGEVYSWGNGDHGSLGHGDEGSRAVPCRVESLSRIERIAVGSSWTSAAVDEKGRLFTWGLARYDEWAEDEAREPGEFEGPMGLGYELDAGIPCQLTPKRVDALSQDRVVGVALGEGFTLAVTDAGAVFSFGFSRYGVLGHGSLDNEVLPRRIEALAQTGRRFVAVAAGDCHALALTEEGDLYGWGDERANGHGREERTPQRVAALIGQRFKLVGAHDAVSCAVTEKGELFTWGESGVWGNLGHQGGQENTPKRVAGLSGVEVAAVAIGSNHTLAADADGVVWAFGRRLLLGLDVLGSADDIAVLTPTPIPTLRVRVLNSP